MSPLRVCCSSAAFRSNSSRSAAERRTSTAAASVPVRPRFGRPMVLCISKRSTINKTLSVCLRWPRAPAVPLPGLVAHAHASSPGGCFELLALVNRQAELNLGSGFHEARTAAGGGEGAGPLTFVEAGLHLHANGALLLSSAAHATPPRPGSRR